VVGRRLGGSPLAVAVANDLPVVTQDDGCDALDGVAGLTIIKV
jgi:hypothetical protein